MESSRSNMANVPSVIEGAQKRILEKVKELQERGEVVNCIEN